MTTQQVAAIAAQKDLADTLGTTQSQLAGLTRAADLSGVAHDELSAAVKKLNNLIGEAKRGTRPPLPLSTGSGCRCPTLWRCRSRKEWPPFRGLLPASERRPSAPPQCRDLFGKSGRALLPMMQDNAATLAAGATSARDLGRRSDIDVAGIAEADDRMADAAAAIEGVKTLSPRSSRRSFPLLPSG